MRITNLRAKWVDLQAVLEQHACEVNGVTYRFRVRSAGAEPRWTGSRRRLLAVEVVAGTQPTGRVFHVLTSRSTGPDELLALVGDGFREYANRTGLLQNPQVDAPDTVAGGGIPRLDGAQAPAGDASAA